MKFDITLLSSYAHDIVINSITKARTIKPGGPALFVEEVFKKEDILYNPIVKKDIQVEVTVYKNGEKSRILPISSTEAPVEMFADTVLISTLLREWDLSKLSGYKGKAFLDVQGYVRDGSNLGGKKHWDSINDIIDSVYALKGTKEEIHYLSKTVVAKQKNKIMIVTNGSNPVDLYVKNTKYTLPVVKVVNLQNTIGAGDTFYAYFVVDVVKGVDPIEATKHAIKKTNNFLQRKVKS